MKSPPPSLLPILRLPLQADILTRVLFAPDTALSLAASSPG